MLDALTAEQFAELQLFFEIDEEEIEERQTGSGESKLLDWFERKRITFEQQAKRL
jgi:hypothetical protein